MVGPKRPLVDPCLRRPFANSGWCRGVLEEENFAADRLKASCEQSADGCCVAGGGLREEQLVGSDRAAGLGEGLSRDALVSAARLDLDRDFRAVRQAPAENDGRGSGGVGEDADVISARLCSLYAGVRLKVVSRRVVLPPRPRAARSRSIPSSRRPSWSARRVRKRGLIGARRSSGSSCPRIQSSGAEQAIR